MPLPLPGTLSSGRGGVGAGLVAGTWTLAYHSVREARPQTRHGPEPKAQWALTPVGCFLVSSRGALKLADRLGVARTSRSGTWASPKNLSREEKSRMLRTSLTCPALPPTYHPSPPSHHINKHPADKADPPQTPWSPRTHSSLAPCPWASRLSSLEGQAPLPAQG